MKSKPPPRIQVLLARESPKALVIRRGPSNHVCTVSWDRRDDSFQLGQWLKGRVYPESSDLSPNGEFFVYFALNGKWESESLGEWTAISRVPYLKALVHWPLMDALNRGGLFISNNRVWIDLFEQDTPYIGSMDGFVLEPEYPGLGMDPVPDPYTYRLIRDGWKLVTSSPWVSNTATVFEKDLGYDWRIRKLIHVGTYHPPGKGVLYHTHELVHPLNGGMSKPDWEWADFDGGRLLWVELGKLVSGRVARNGVETESTLFDFNDMEFSAIEAPY